MPGEDELLSHYHSTIGSRRPLNLTRRNNDVVCGRTVMHDARPSLFFFVVLSGVPVFTVSAASAHRPMVVVPNTARDLLDTNQTDQRVVLHNLTHVMTYCCPYACSPRLVIVSTPDELIT